MVGLLLALNFIREVRGVWLTYSGIFLENNFKHQNAHNNELGGAISANYRGFFSISCLLFDIILPVQHFWTCSRIAIPFCILTTETSKAQNVRIFGTCPGIFLMISMIETK